MSTEAIELLKAYRARLKAAGKLKEAAAVARCIVLIRQKSKSQEHPKT